MDKFIAQIRNKTLVFNTDQHQAIYHDFLSRNEGKKVRIELAKNPVSDELRGYYFAAVISTVKSVIEDWRGIPDEDVHEILKKMFNYFESVNPLTKRVERYGRSAMSSESTAARAMDFIEKIRIWLMDEYKIELPSPEEYKHIRDMAGDDGKPFEDYPKMKSMPTI